MKIIFLLLPLIVLWVVACSKDSHQATFMLNENNVSISVELDPIHPFLAEYNRFLILTIKGRNQFKQKLFPDTGGYTSANLYKCSPQKYMLKGYLDAWIIDLENGVVLEGKCKSNQSEYVGVFDGGGSKPWKFYLASERKEIKLEPRGG